MTLGELRKSDLPDGTVVVVAQDRSYGYRPAAAERLPVRVRSGKLVNAKTTPRLPGQHPDEITVLLIT